MGNLPGSRTLYELLCDYLKSRSTSPLNDGSTQRVLDTVRIEQNEPEVSGVFRTGDYGYESDLFDTQTMRLTHHRTVDETELTPFFFLASLPKQNKHGLLLLQKFGQLSAKTVFNKDWEGYIRGQLPIGDDAMLEINPVLAPELVDTWLATGRVTNATLVRTSLPDDLTDYLNGRGMPLPDLKEMKVVFQMKRNGEFLDAWRARFRQVADGTLEVHELIELPGFVPNAARVNVRVEGREHVIDITDTSRVRTYYDISSIVDKGADGHPVFDSIREIGQGVLRQLMPN